MAIDPSKFVSIWLYRSLQSICREPWRSTSAFCLGRQTDRRWIKSSRNLIILVSYDIFCLDKWRLQIHYPGGRYYHVSYCTKYQQKPIDVHHSASDIIANHFLCIKITDFYSDSTEIVPEVQLMFGSDNGLLPNRWQPLLMQHWQR